MILPFLGCIGNSS